MYQTKKKIVDPTSIFRQNQEHYSHNADRILSDRKQYYVNNLDKIREKCRTYYAENIESIRKKHQVYKSNNAKIIKQQKHKHFIKNQHKIHYSKIVLQWKYRLCKRKGKRLLWEKSSCS